jgi:hypothetical protein
MLASIILAAALNLSSMHQVGQGNLSWMFWDAYTATLYSKTPDFKRESEFALKLEYKLEIDGADIAQRSIDEMEKQEKLAPEKAQKWLKAMKEIFPNVDKTTSITGVNKPNYGAVFYKNGKKIGEIKDTEFAKRFFDIWLSPKTSEPKLRKQLLGEVK